MELSKRDKVFTIIYFVIVLAELFATNLQEIIPYLFVIKPAIVFSLIVFFLMQGKHLKKRTQQITLLALVFSLGGDVLLMFVERSSNFFLGGLSSFLLAHIMYIWVFNMKRNKSKRPKTLVFILTVYALIFFLLLNEGLADMKVPVVIYMMVIIMMTIFASLRNDTPSRLSYSLVFWGAVIFIISDSILAANKFYFSIPMSGMLIMSTYSIAQYMIVMGILRQKD